MKSSTNHLASRPRRARAWGPKTATTSFTSISRLPLAVDVALVVDIIMLGMGEGGIGHCHRGFQVTALEARHSKQVQGVGHLEDAGVLGDEGEDAAFEALGALLVVSAHFLQIAARVGDHSFWPFL